MRDATNIDRVVKACLSNAESLLEAAKAVRTLGKNYIAYHLATIALEEIGKASMVATSSLRQASRTSNDRDDEEHRPVDWIEDHERKLFWAAGKKITTIEGPPPRA